jgi:ABC-type multidrug transport system fused ATPase/permease subunit
VRSGTSDTARAVRLLAQFTKGWHRTYVLSLGWLVIFAATAVFEAYPLAYLIDYFKGNKSALALPGLSTGRASTVAVLTIAVVLISLVNSAAESLAQIHLARSGRALGFQLRMGLFAHLQRLPLAFHDRRRTGDVITRVTGDVKEVEKFVGDSLGGIAGSVLLLIATLAFLGWNSWQVMLVALMIIPVLAAISMYFSRRIKAAALRQRAREGEIASATQEMLTSIRVVQTFGRASHDEERFAVHSGKAMDAGLEAARLDAWFSLVVSVLEGASIAAVIWIGLWLLDRGVLTLGLLVLFVILVQQMFKPTKKVIKEWNRVARVYASIERIADLLDQEVTVRDEPGAVPAPPLKAHVEFKEVDFSYDLAPDGARSGAEEKQRGPALRSISFEVSPGEAVALVGHSGAGKTTIAQLVPRLYDADKGKVLIDGQDVRSFTLESLRSQISMVLQETVLLRGTVAENIAYGRVDATREQILSAAVCANAHEFIAAMPEGYDTELSERASNLSAGQRQRISIARAFIRDTPLLILDEPTTGLDAGATEHVLGALRALIADKTTLIISHDLNLIRWADRILVMREGGIVEVGTHENLLEQNGHYAQLHASQFSDRQGRPRPAEALPGNVPGNGASGRNGSVRSCNGNGHVPEIRFDPLQSPELQRELPDLDAALDGNAMREVLQEALIGPPLDAGWLIDDCTAGKALYLPSEGCKLRYELEIRGNGEARHAIVCARLFNEVEARDAYVRERLGPLVALANGREELRPFTTPATALDALPMVLYAFPIDPDLPTLINASDPTEMRTVFRETLPELLGEPVTLDGCRVQPVQYARRRRCVLSYDLDGTLAASDEPLHCTIYGKVVAREAELMEPLLGALRERALDGNGGHAFRVPRLLAVRPELNLALLEKVPGTRRIGPLIKSRVQENGEGTASLPLEEAVDACAQIAATLHGWEIEVAPHRSLDDDLNALRPDLEVVAGKAPELGAELEDSIRRIADAASRVAPLPLELGHGDFTPSQILFEDNTVGLLDFDGLCQAEPARDVGHFCAYLRVACAKAERAAGKGRSSLGDELVDRFVRTYVRVRETPGGEVRRLHGRAGIYESLRLVKMSVGSWQQLKAARLAAALEVLEEECLPKL